MQVGMEVITHITVLFYQWDSFLVNHKLFLEAISFCSFLISFGQISDGHIVIKKKKDDVCTDIITKNEEKVKNEKLETVQEHTKYNISPENTLTTENTSNLRSTTEVIEENISEKKDKYELPKLKKRKIVKKKGKKSEEFKHEDFKMINNNEENKENENKKNEIKENKEEKIKTIILNEKKEEEFIENKKENKDNQIISNNINFH